MLGVKTYGPAQVAAARAKVDADVAAGKGTAFFNNMVLVLDYLFMHRLRGVEGKDGNPLNEVRVLASSIVHHDAVFTDLRPPSEPGRGPTGFKLTPDRTVLGLADGEPIALTKADFTKLADAFFDEIERRYA